MALGNLFKLFQDVTRGEPQQIATVINRDGPTYTVQMTAGNIIDVQGVGAFEIDSKVFIKGTKIVGEAPNLTYVEIEV